MWQKYTQCVVEIKTDPNIVELWIECKKLIIHTQPNLTKLLVICSELIIHKQPELIHFYLSGTKLFKLPYFPKLEILSGDNIYLNYFDNLKSLRLQHSKIKKFKLNNISQLELEYCRGKIFIPNNFTKAVLINCVDLRKAPLGCHSGIDKTKKHGKDRSYVNFTGKSKNKFLRRIENLRYVIF
jgi:hypothetical protein